jgi:hypothetical protein
MGKREILALWQSSTCIRIMTSWVRTFNRRIAALTPAGAAASEGFETALDHPTSPSRLGRNTNRFRRVGASVVTGALHRMLADPISASQTWFGSITVIVARADIHREIFDRYHHYAKETWEKLIVSGWKSSVAIASMRSRNPARSAAAAES